MKTIVILCAIVFTQTLFSQLDIAELTIELNGLTKVKTENGWNAHMIKYQNDKNQTLYIVSFDAQWKPEKGPYSGALSAYKYDSLGRQIEGRYYDTEGNLYFGDWPPIYRNEYDANGNLIWNIYYGLDEEPLKSIISKQEYLFDENNLCYEERIYSLDSTGYLLHGDICIHLLEYNDEDLLIEKRLVNAAYELPDDSLGCIFKYKYGLREGERKVVIYDKNMFKRGGWWAKY